MSSDTVYVIAYLLAPFLLLMVTYVIGSWIERRHFAGLRIREEAHRRFPVLTFESIPPDWTPHRCRAVQGSVVVSLDYFKRFVAGLRGLVGGRVKSYEPLLDRARREAVLRMIEQAKAGGYDAIVNMRLETAKLASGRGNGEGTAGIEMLAYGTGVKLTRPLD